MWIKHLLGGPEERYRLEDESVGIRILRGPSVIHRIRTLPARRGSSIGLCDDLSDSVASRARLLGGEKPLLDAHLPLSFTGRAGTRLGPGLRRRSRGAAAARPAEDIAERVGKTRKAGGHTAGRARARIASSVAVTVVIGGTLVGVAQNLVRLFCLLEELFGLGVIRIAIRMMLHGE